jgi:hypothetical protein
MTGFMDCLQLGGFPILVIPVNVMQVNRFIRHQFETTSCACMVLPLDRFSRSPVVEFVAPLTPVEQVTVKRGFRSPDFDELVFGVRDRWKGLS